MTSPSDSVIKPTTPAVAAAAAVVILARLAADPSQPDRHEILALLSSLAIGRDAEHLPGGVDVAGWRHDVATLEATDARRDPCGVEHLG